MSNPLLGSNGEFKARLGGKRRLLVLVIARELRGLHGQVRGLGRQYIDSWVRFCQECRQSSFMVGYMRFREVVRVRRCMMTRKARAPVKRTRPGLWLELYTQCSRNKTLVTEGHDQKVDSFEQHFQWFSPLILPGCKQDFGDGI